MFTYFGSLVLIVLSNTFYQICAKSVPNKINPFASLTITYFVGTLICLTLYFITSKNFKIFSEFKKLNWAPFILGIVVVGLEAGYLFAYKAGWHVSVLMIIQASLLAGILILVGKFLFSEPLKWNKILGVAICLIGLTVINIR